MGPHGWICFLYISGRIRSFSTKINYYGKFHTFSYFDGSPSEPGGEESLVRTGGTAGLLLQPGDQALQGPQPGGGQQVQELVQRSHQDTDT